MVPGKCCGGDGRRARVRGGGRSEPVEEPAQVVELELRAGLVAGAAAALVATVFAATVLATGALTAGAAAALLAVFLAAFGTFLAPDTYAFRSVPARNRGMAVALARLRSPVRGLRTIRAERCTFSKTPNPVMVTFSPVAVW